MKNILNTKTDGTPALLSNVDESGNSLYVNGTEISSSSWIGEGTYTFTVGTHTYSISKAPDNDGNYQLLKVSDYTYQFVKIVSKTIREEIDDIETALTTLDSTVGGLSGDVSTLQTAVSGKVSKSGDTMTGALTVQGMITKTASGNAYMKTRHTAHHRSKNSTNGIDSDIAVGGYQMVDSEDQALGYLFTQMNATGSLHTQWAVYNTKTDGTAVSNVIRMVIAKNGSQTYFVSNAANFRSAIGAAASSSREYKENIEPITEEEAKKILRVPIYSYDYKDNFGGDKNQYGTIAEELLDIIPYAVNVPEEYVERFDPENKTNQALITIDYWKLIPHLIKMIQIQDRRIQELESKLSELEAKIGG